MHLTSGDLKIFYCGEVVDLGILATERDTEIYVPAESYEAFDSVLSEYYHGSLLKAKTIITISTITKTVKRSHTFRQFRRETDTRLEAGLMKPIA